MQASSSGANGPMRSPVSQRPTKTVNISLDKGNRTYRQNSQAQQTTIFKLPPIGDVLTQSINNSILQNNVTGTTPIVSRFDAALSKMPLDVISKLDALTERPFAKKKQSAPSTQATMGGSPMHPQQQRQVLEQNLNSMIDGTTLDDIALRKALNEAFEADPNSYLGTVQEFVHRVTTSGTAVRHFIPKSIIPEEYFIYSSSPIFKGFKNVDEVSFNEEQNTWEKLVFPSKEPTRRVEIYLLAKTMDEMLLQMRQAEKIPHTEDEFFEVTLEKMCRSYNIHLTALFEILRQEFSISLERGILLKKIFEYFSEFYDVVVALLNKERKRTTDFQNIINEYENLLTDITREKDNTREELEHLMRENNQLFEEKETLRLREAEYPKYELVLKLLKNRGTWEEFLRANNEQVASQTIKQSLAHAKKRKNQPQDQKESSDSDSNVKPNVNFTNPSRQLLTVTGSDSELEFGVKAEALLQQASVTSVQNGVSTIQDDVTYRLIKLITSSMNETLHKLYDLSSILENEFQKVLTTKLEHTRLRNVQELSLQLVLESFYDVNSRINELNNMHLARVKQREKDDEIRREVLIVQQQKPCIRIRFEPIDDEDRIKIHFFDISDGNEEKPIDVDKDSQIDELLEQIQKLKSDIELQKKAQERQKDELQLKAYIISSGERDLQEKKRKYKDRISKQDFEINDLMKRIADLEKGVQNRPISVVFNIIQQDPPKQPIEVVKNYAKPPKAPSPDRSPSVEPPKQQEVVKEKKKKLSPEKPSTPEQKPVLERSDSVLSNKSGRSSRKSNVSSSSPVPEVKSNSRARRAALLNIGENDNVARRVKEERIQIDDDQDLLESSIDNAQQVQGYSDDVFETSSNKKSNMSTRASTRQSTTSPDSNLRDKHTQTDESSFFTEESALLLEPSHFRPETASSIDLDSLPDGEEIGPFSSHTPTEMQMVPNKPVKKVVLSNVVNQSKDSSEPNTSRSIGFRPRKPTRNFGDVPKNERLAGILAKTVKFKRDGQVKSLLWLLRLMSGIYKNKIDHDLTEEKVRLTVPISQSNGMSPPDTQASTMTFDVGMSSSSTRMSLPEFVFEHLKQIYGTQKLVDEYAGSVVATIMKYKQTDKRVEIFGKFVNEEFELPVLDMFLKAWRMVEEFKHGPEYCQQKPLDDMPKYARISKVRALYILKALKREIPSLVDQIVRLMERKCVEVAEDEFKKAMSQAGYKYIPSQFNPVELWGVDAITARQTINKIDFLEIVCQVIVSTMLEEEERHMLATGINFVVHDGINVLNLQRDNNVVQSAHASGLSTQRSIQSEKE